MPKNAKRLVRVRGWTPDDEPDDRHYRLPERLFSHLERLLARGENEKARTLVERHGSRLEPDAVVEVTCF